MWAPPYERDDEMYQSWPCHPERSEGSRAMGREMLPLHCVQGFGSFAQHDRASFGRESSQSPSYKLISINSPAYRSINSALTMPWSPTISASLSRTRS